MSDHVFNWRGVFWAVVLIILWLAASAVVGCSHMQVVKDPNVGPAVRATPEPGRF